MTIQIFKNGQLQTSLPEDQAFTSILSDFDKYKQYYENAGYVVKQVGTPSTTLNRESQLQAYAAGMGPKPAGLQSGFAAPTGYDKGGALAQGLQKPTDPNAPRPNIDGQHIMVLMPNQQMQMFSIQDPALDAALSGGARPVELDGGIMTDVKQFNGGWVVRRGAGYIPLNILAGGDWIEGQQEALAAGGETPGVINGEYQGTGGEPSPGGWVPGGSPIPGGTGGAGGGAGGPGGPGGYQYNGWMGNQSANAQPLNNDLETALRELMQEARTQGLRGQEALTGLVDDYKNYLGFSRAAAEQTFNKRNELTDTLLGKVMPGIESALGTMNQATGLSPEAMQALRLNAIEGPERSYQGQVEQLKTQLGQRGAYGGGALPGDAGALVRGYAPLMQGRDAARSNLLANAILADEQRKFETLGLNRQTALGAMNTGAGLAGSLASAYNPASMFQANEGALSGLGNTLGARTSAGFQGLNTAGGLLQTGFKNQPTSFKNLLLASLIGTGGNILSDPSNWQKIGDFFGGLFGGGGSNTPTQSAGNLPIPTNPFPTNPAPTTPTTPPYV